MEHLQAFARCARITRDLDDIGQVIPELFTEKAEKALHEALSAVLNQERQPGSMEDFRQAVIGLVPAITQFFDEVLVMDDDPEIRTNRLNLVGSIVNLSDGVVDMSHLEGF